MRQCLRMQWLLNSLALHPTSLGSLLALPLKHTHTHTHKQTYPPTHSLYHRPFTHRFHSGHDLLQLILGLISDALRQGAGIAVNDRLCRRIAPVQDGDAAHVVHGHGADQRQKVKSFFILLKGNCGCHT